MVRTLFVTNSFNEVRNFWLCAVINASRMSSFQSFVLCSSHLCESSRLWEDWLLKIPWPEVKYFNRAWETAEQYMSNCWTEHEKFLDVTDNKKNKLTGSFMNICWISQLVKGKVCKKQMNLTNSLRGAQGTTAEAVLQGQQCPGKLSVKPVRLRFPGQPHEKH